jgi:hypothetical protein
MARPRGAWFTGLVLVMAPACWRYPVLQPPAVAYGAVADTLIAHGLQEADLVVLGSPDTMAAEDVMSPRLAAGSKLSWWNVRITVDSVVKGKLGRAKRMDYGDLPPYLVPPRPFRLAERQVMVQQGGRWLTAPLVLGTRGVYFLKKCWNCVDLPDRTQYHIRASPWLAILALEAGQWERVRGLAGQ